MNHKPIIAIVGRPNVGKSALFNKIARRQIALVFDRPGVTRDRIEVDCHHHGKEFRLIDTGGIGLGDDSGFESAVQQEVEIALEVADHVLFVVDAKEGLTPLDRDVAKKLRKKHACVHLVVNKVDHEGLAKNAVDFDELGFVSSWMVSATHGLGVKNLMDHVSDGWEAKTRDSAAESYPERIAIVGVPNVGKSSIINSLFASERVIVSEKAGTTRDAVDVSFEHMEKKFTLIDTAGMRKESRIQDELEQIMTGRSVHAIKRSHICLLVIDAIRKVGQQEKKIAALITENHKPCVIVVNKWDLARQELRASEREGSMSSAERTLRKEFTDDLRSEMFGLSYAPIAFVSAKESRKMDELMKRVHKIATTRKHVLGTGVLNRILERALAKKSPPRKGGRIFKIYYATQKTDEKKGIPTILAFVNNKNLLPEDYLRYLDSCIRKEYPYEGCPIAWEFKEKVRT